MYERMLNKEIVPTTNDIYKTMGKEATVIFEELNDFMISSYDLSFELKFPFGNKYGWGYKISHKSKHLCYVFFEESAFTVMIQIGKNELKRLYDKFDDLSSKAKEMWEKRYPCGEGGWLHYRVLCNNDLNDIKTLISIKKSPIKS